MLYLSDSPEPKEIRELGERAVNDDSVYRDNVVDDYNYYFGDQWPEGDKRALDRQLRPHLEINRVKQIVDLVINTQASSRTTTRVMPVGGEDVKVADVIQDLLLWMNEHAGVRWKKTRVYADGLIAGRGYMMVGVKYGNNIYGDVDIYPLDPPSVIFDPTSVKPDLEDAGFIIRQSFMTPGEIQSTYGVDIESAYPDPQDTVISAFMYHPDRLMNEYGKYHVIECWYKVWEKVPVVVNMETGDPMEMPNEQKAVEWAQMWAVAGKPIFTAGKMEMKRTKVKTICGGEVLV